MRGVEGVREVERKGDRKLRRMEGRRETTGRYGQGRECSGKKG